MPEQLLEYETFVDIRDGLAERYQSRINMSSNAQLVYGDVYVKNLEDGKRETVAQRMAAVAVDVASNDLRYMSETTSLEEKLQHVRERANRYMEMQAENVFRANTPTNINFGRWTATFDEDGELTGYAMKNQLGSACFVIPLEDTFGETAEGVYGSDGILAAWEEQQLLQQGGGGTGIAGSALRPKGAILGYNPAVDGMKSMRWETARGVASGWESFLEHYFNSSTEAVMQGNSRRGANMGILRIDHPDFLDHIYAKYGSDERRLELRLKNFNLSLAVTDEFMEAAINGGTYTLYNPHRAEPRTKRILEKKWGVKDPEIVRREDIATKEQFVNALKKNEANRFQPVPLPSMYLADNGVDVMDGYKGEKIGIIVDGIVRIYASTILDIMTNLANSNGEPGVFFVDRANEYNPTLDFAEYEATNPCGEQPLISHEACNLGSINVGKFARYKTFNSMEEAMGDGNGIPPDKWARVEERRDGKIGVTYYDWAELDRAIEDGLRFLDNVIDRSDFPSNKVTETVRSTRKVGLGYMGVGSAMMLMKMRYGSDASYEFGEALAKRLHDKAREASMKLAEERGVFPLWDISFFNPESENHEWFMSDPQTIRDRFRGSRRLSDLVKRDRAMTYGVRVRNSYQTTQAPTGTISRTVGEKDSETGLDNLSVSSGIEPFLSLGVLSNIINTTVSDFSHAAVELLKREGLYSPEILKAISENSGSAHVYSHTPESVAKVLEQIPEEIRDVMVTAVGGERGRVEITPEQHIRMSAIFQKWTDSAISKTCNLPQFATPEDMRNEWVSLWGQGSKGGTFYRNKSRGFQILNVVESPGLEGKVDGNGRKTVRPLLQRSFTLELPYKTSLDKEGTGDIDFNPDRCFTTVTYTPVLGRITGVFQSIPEIDPERLSSMADRNIERSRALKDGRPLKKVIEDMEKIKYKSGRRGVVDDVAVMNGSNERLRFQVEGATTTEDELKTFYVISFLTGEGEDLDPKRIEERMHAYETGRISLRSIINTQGKIKLEEDSNDTPSILGSKTVIKLPEGVSEKLCPECG